MIENDEKKVLDFVMPPWHNGGMPNHCTINEPHCENCGSTDYEDLHCGDQGYSACCNEIVVSGSQSCRNHHGER